MQRNWIGRSEGLEITFGIENSDHKVNLLGESKSGNPADCVGCGNCEGHCPQKISIIEQLKTVSSTFA